MSRLPAALLLTALVIGGVACSSSSDDSGGAAAAATTAPHDSTVPTDIPAGTTLRIGDQLDYLQTILGLAGEDHDFPYAVEYSAFVGGPPMLQAFQAGAIDSGFVGSTPLIFAQAGDQDIVAVAGWASDGGGYDLVTAPGTTGIDGWGDLEGHTVAFQAGTAGESALLQALDEAGLGLDDVTAVDLPQTQIASALQSGAADAGLEVEPLTSAYLAQNPTAKDVDQASLVTDRSSYLIAASDTLADAGKTAALADYTQRLVRSFTYLAAHPEQLAQAVYVGTYGLPVERANEIVARNGGTSFLTFPDDIVPAQQHLADLLHDIGVIPDAVDVTAEFDARFAPVVAVAAAAG
jgi:sulfonate transport system substrate-binding protein